MLQPMFAMFIWIWVMVLLTLFHRIKAVQSRQLKPKYFKTFSGVEPPELILKLNRHISNLFEVPPIFMITCLTIIVLKIEDPIFITLAWAFVGLRVLHSFIHIGINHVIARLLSFASSVLCLVVIWVRIMILAA